MIAETAWAFTRDSRGRYVLAAELIVRAKTTNPKGYHYGPYRVWGDRERSRYFSLEKGPDVELLIRAFSLSIGGGVLGRSFQGPGAVRMLTALPAAMTSRGPLIAPRRSFSPRCSHSARPAKPDDGTAARRSRRRVGIARRVGGQLFFERLDARERLAREVRLRGRQRLRDVAEGLSRAVKESSVDLGGEHARLHPCALASCAYHPRAAGSFTFWSSTTWCPQGRSTTTAGRASANCRTGCATI